MNEVFSTNNEKDSSVFSIYLNLSRRSDVSTQNYEIILNRYGICFECDRFRTTSGWCQKCQIDELKSKFSNWTSGNKDLDHAIQNIQINAKDYYESLEWIPYNQFDVVEYSAQGGFSTVYCGYWIEGPKRILDEEIDDYIRNGPTKVAIKRIEESKNLSKQYLDKLLKYHKCIQNRSLADYYGITRDPTGSYAFVMRFYENGNLYQYLDYAMGTLCWRDIVDMLWGISSGLEQIHKYNLYHGNLHCGNLLVENEAESIDTRISDVAICDDPNPSLLSEQFDAAEEKKFADLESNSFTRPEIHPQAIYTSQPLNFKLSFDA
ncbi:6318_t:CDS:2 [Acaulospora morrowiae]|uniref:6318_t:CDS:1 n=1 Tax=Acaulospora morrowiae TaxID=94023 RepID=A0A9N8WMN4_9GLOM|nr:6318_t:CDS:2 [Acaulospora morrowiae]